MGLLVKISAINWEKHGFERLESKQKGSHILKKGELAIASEPQMKS